MERNLFLQKVSSLRSQGKSIRAIAAELEVNRGRVDRALKALPHLRADRSALTSNSVRSSVGLATDMFVGRQREMADLRAALEDTISGHGRLVMLAGEPGIGKTRTAQQLATYATQKGAQVLWGRCHMPQGAPPYWPWVQVMRSYVQGKDREQLRSELGAGAGNIAEIVPEIKEYIPDLKPPPPLDGPEQARYRLFDSVATFLKNASRNQPLVLTLDNLHWTDKPSLLLLEFLVQELGDSPLLVVGSYRDTELTPQHPLTLTLGELVREPLFQKVLLRGLSEEEVGHYIAVTSEINPPRDLVEAVHTQTEGNPLFMTEVVQLLVQEGEFMRQQGLEDQPWSVQIPVGVHEAIGRRLSLMSEGCTEVLTVASVVGREFELGLLERLEDGRSQEDLLEVFEEALEARVIEEVPPSPGRYRFTHVLIQNTLAREVSTMRQALLHRRIGETLEELYEGDLEVHATELAYHFGEAGPMKRAEKIVRYSLLAGEQALSTYAWEEALSHFQRGLAAKGVPLAGAEPAKDTEEALLLAGLGRAQATTLHRHQLRMYVTTLRRAVDYYVRSGDVARAVAIADYSVPSIVGHQSEMAQLFARVLTIVPPGSHAAGRTLRNYGLHLGLDEVDYQGAHEALLQALTISQEQEDITLEAQVLSSACEVDYWHLRFEEAIKNGNRAIELAKSAGDLFAEALGHRYTTRPMIVTGDLEGARKHASEGLLVAEQLNDRNLLILTLFDNEECNRLMGDWATARDFHHRLMEISPQDIRHLCPRALLEYETGNLTEGQQYMERILEVVPLTVAGPNTGYAFPALALPVIARVSGVVDHLSVAESAARTVLDEPRMTPTIESRVRSGLGMLAVLRQDRAAAAEQYPALASQGGTMTPGAELLSIDRLLALLSQTTGNLDKAVEHFEDALAFCRKAGYRPELAWSCCDYADTLLQSNQPGDLAKARSLLKEALSIASELGMKPLMERVATRLDQVEVPESPAYPDSLTEREVEVLRLVAAGKRNRQIGEALHISLNTVANHVTNIFNKTGCTNRAEATAYAYRHHMVS